MIEEIEEGERMERVVKEPSKQEIRKALGLHSIKDEHPHFIKKSLKQIEWTQNNEYDELFGAG